MIQSLQGDLPMSNPLTDAQMSRPLPFFPKGNGKPRPDDRRMPNDIIVPNCSGLQWHDAPKEQSPAEYPPDLLKAMGRQGIFVGMMEGLVSRGSSSENDDNRRAPSEGASHGDGPSARKGCV